MDALDPGVALAPGAELTVSQAAPLRATLLARLEAGAWTGLDLSAVEAMDSAGVQLLLALRRSLADEGLPWTLSGASEPVREVLALYGLTDLLPAESPAR
jgi:anti-sigma B factor antagonist